MDAFAQQMKDKLLAQYLQGWSGWDNPSIESALYARLLEKVEIGSARRQEVDVANIVMMLWNLCQSETIE